MRSVEDSQCLEATPELSPTLRMSFLPPDPPAPVTYKNRDYLLSGLCCGLAFLTSFMFPWQFRVSQNSLEGTSGAPTAPSPKAGSPEQVVQDRGQVGLDISRRDSSTSLHSLCQGSGTLTIGKFFLMFRWNTHHSVPIAPHSVTVSQRKEPGPIQLIPTIKYL